MAFNKKPSLALLLAGFAAFAYYRYTKMSPEEKEELMSKLKVHGKKIFDQFMPENLKNTFAEKKSSHLNGAVVEDNYTG